MNLFHFLNEKLSNEKKVFFIRFGDSEFVTMMGKEHRNYKYNKNLAHEIEESHRIEDENYLIANVFSVPYDEFYTFGVYFRYPWEEKIIKTFHEKGFNANKIYENMFIFQTLTVFKPKLVKAFLNTHIRPKKKMFIGCTPKEVAEKLYGPIAYYIQIPSQHAYESIDTWWKQIEENVHDVDLVIPSAGSSSNVIAQRLWKMNVNCNLIDVGSLVDAFDKKTSRIWIRLQGHKAFKLIDDKVHFTLKEKCTHLLKDIKFFFRKQIK